MLKKMKHLIMYFVIVAVIISSTSYIHIIESKTLSDSVNKNINLSTMALKVEEFEKDNIYRVKDTYTGELTGYVFNCPLCGGTLGCLRSYDITDGKTYYDDSVYGRVRIVASSSNLSCGSIVRMNNSRLGNDDVFAIVLDRGVLGNALDLLVSNVEDAYALGRVSVTYDVLRNGWENNES